MMDSLPVTNKTVGEPESITNKTLETGAGAVQVGLSDTSWLLHELTAYRTSLLSSGSALTSMPSTRMHMIQSVTLSSQTTTVLT
jgi:hypothetical protein